MRPSGEEERGCGAGVEPATSPVTAVTMEQRPVAGRRSPIAFGALPLSYPQHQGTDEESAQGDIVPSDNLDRSARATQGRGPHGQRGSPPAEARRTTGGGGGDARPVRRKPPCAGFVC